MREPLTARQAEVLATIKHLIKQYGYSPTVAELANALEVLPNAAYQHIKTLQAKGRITTEAGRARTIKIAKRGKKNASIHK